MEVYVLDSLFRRSEVIDRFESLIWTERWASHGDFELKIRSSLESRSMLKTGTVLGLNVSHRAMIIETIEDSTLEDGTEVLEVKGPSLESIFKDRVVYDTNPRTATAMQQVRSIVYNLYTAPGDLSPYDKILELKERPHPLIPASTIPEPVDPITITIAPQSFYDLLTSLGNTWIFGFRLLINFDDTKLYFQVYTGTDRTMSQVVRPPVLFTASLDNLQNIKEFHTIEGAKNVAYVFSPVGFKEVLATGVADDVDRFDRRVLPVIADDITGGTPAEIDAALIQRGKEALSEHQEFQAFDGEINQKSQYRYNADYYLGDIVEMRGKDGVGNQMRVTEQIFVSDREGERAYPTLALNKFISTGSWLSWGTNKKWIDYDADTATVWATLP